MSIETDINENEDFNKFLKDPESFMLTDDEIQYLENGKYYEVEKTIDLSINTKSKNNEILGRVNISFYYNGELVIYSMMSSVERQGMGKEVLRLMNEKLKNINIKMSVIDILDESREFWAKMEELHYVY
jgi:predicted acetyltransferase